MTFVTQLIPFLVAAAFVGSLACVPVGVAFWTSLGNSRPVSRIAGMMIAILLLGYAFDFSDPSFDRIAVFPIMFFGGAVTWLIPPGKLRIASGLLFAGLAIWMIANSLRLEGPSSFDAVVPVTIPIVAIASFTFGLRLFGFRVLKLTGDNTDRDLEIGTGRNLDDWVQFLDRKNALRLDRAAVVRIIREDGAPFVWQRIVTNAYEVVHGRVLVGIDEVGRPQTVSANASIGWSDIFSSHDGRMRWSIRQMLFLSVVVAVLSGVINALQVPFPDPLFALILLAVSFSSGIIAIAVAYSFLSVSGKWQVNVACCAIVAFTAFAMTLICPVLGLGFAIQENAFVLGSFLFFAIAFSLACILVRHQGYRLVLVGRVQPLMVANENQELAFKRKNPSEPALPVT